MRAEEDGCPSLSKKSKFVLPQPFCSIQDLSGLHDALVRVIFTQLTQMLILSRNTLIDIPRNF